MQSVTFGLVQESAFLFGIVFSAGVGVTEQSMLEIDIRFGLAEIR